MCKCYGETRIFDLSGPVFWLPRFPEEGAEVVRGALTPAAPLAARGPLAHPWCEAVHAAYELLPDFLFNGQCSIETITQLV